MKSTKVKHLDHLNMTVANFTETHAWYSSIFGFELVEEGADNGEPWGVLKSGEAMLCVYQRSERKHVDKDFQIQEGLHTINHYAFRINDRDAWLRTIASHSLDLYFGGEVSYPHSSSWYVKDPTGYMIEVVLWKGDEVRFP